MNIAPRAGEEPRYIETTDATYHRAYGLIALIPGLTSEKSVIIVQGTSTAGTEATGDFLFDNRLFEAFLRQIGGKPGLIPYFELLLQTETVSGNAQQAKVVAFRVIG